MHGRVIQIKMNNMHLEKKTNHEILALTHLKSMYSAHSLITHFA